MFGKKKNSSSINGITEGVIWKQLLIFFFPILFGSFFQQMYNTVDTIIVGRAVGTNALAAVGATGSMINLIIGFFTGLASGATVIVSQRFGAGDDDGVSQSVHTGTALALICSLLITVLGIAFGPAILKVMNTPEEVYGDACKYVLIYFAGSTALVIYNIGSGILRALGDSKRPMIYLIVCCVANVFFDLFCVVLLNMGVAGAAFATVLSEVLSAVLVLIRMLRMNGAAKLSIRKIRINREILGSILHIGIPSGLQSSMYSISNLIIAASVNSFGAVTIAAWTAHGRMDGIVWMVNGAFSVAITTFVGQNFGAQKYDRMRKSVRICLVMSISTMAAISAGLMLLGRPLFTIFTEDPGVIEVGMEILFYITPYYALFEPIEILSGAMRGTGDSIIPTVITGIGACLLRVLWVVIMVGQYHSLAMLSVAYPITWGVTAIIFAVYYLQGGWLRRRIKALGFAPEVREKRNQKKA